MKALKRVGLGPSRQAYFGKRRLKMKENCRLWLDQVSIVSQQKTSDFGQIRLAQLVNRKPSSSSQQSIVGSHGRLWLDQVSIVSQQESFSRKTLVRLDYAPNWIWWETLVRLGQYSQSIEKVFTKELEKGAIVHQKTADLVRLCQYNQ